MHKIYKAVYEDIVGLMSKHDYDAITSGCTKNKSEETISNTYA